MRTLRAGAVPFGRKREVEGFFHKDLLPADTIARAISYAIAQPSDVDVNEIVVRPTVQAY